MTVPRPRSEHRRRVGRLGAAMLAGSLLAAACTNGESEQGSETEDSTSTTLTEPVPTPGFDQVVALQGQLAVISGHEVSVMLPDGTGVIPVAGSETEVAGQPTWSPDGSRLAWTVTDGVTARVDVGVPGAELDGSTAFDTAPFYLGWDTQGSRLAYLRPQPNSGALEMGTFEPGTPPTPGEGGAPLYLSWRPEVDALALHVDSDRTELLEVGADPTAATPLAPTTGQFAVPVWIDDDTIVYVADGLLLSLDVEDGTTQELLDIGQVSRLVLSPDRTRLAYLTVSDGTQTIGFARQDAPSDDVASGVRLRVFDFTTGRDELVTDVAPLAFEWSPNGAYLSWLAPAGGGFVAWHIWSFAGELGILEPYRPSDLDTAAYLPFFDQYAQSHSRWDPDGLAMAFAGVISGQAGIWVDLVEDDLGPYWVAEGDYVTWSPPAGGGGGASIL